MILDHNGKAINKVTIDFETRSKADLRAVGAWNYARHPSTQVMCLSWRSTNGEKGFWHMRHPHMIKKLRANLEKATNLLSIAKTDDLREKRQATVIQIQQDIEDLKESDPAELTRLFALIAEGYLVEAHNAFFERVIWMHVCIPKMQWPEIDEDQWRCSAAKASMHALPRDLERASGEMCPDEKKDSEGHRLMLKLCKPAKPTKADPDREWHELPDDLRGLWKYCEQDTKAEEALSESLIELPPKELELWQMDQRMNLRGMYSDHDLAHKAIDISTTLTEQLNTQLSETTYGELEKGSQRAKIKQWLNDNCDEEVEGTGAPVLDRLMQNPAYANTKVSTVVDIVRAVNRTSIKKYQAMLDRSDIDDHRIRDMMMYHGAATGRWSGKGVQPHNFPRGFIKDMELTCEELLGYPLDELLMFHSRKDLMDILSWALRGGLCAPPGRRLYVADYAAIEARVLVWLANDEAALNVFRAGKDIYKDMATAIYGCLYEEVDSEQRRMGKQAILGLGYQMGAPKFWDTIAGYEPWYKGVDASHQPFLMMEGTKILEKIKACFKADDAISDALKYGFKLSSQQEATIRATFLRGDDDLFKNVYYFLFIRNVVIKYREKYSSVKDLWKAHNAAAIDAVADPGSRHEVGKITWYMDDNDFLRCELPSGRTLFYRKPHLGKNKFGNHSLYYWSVDAVTKQWRRTGTYGGKLVENFTQAVARDLMGDGMLEVDKHDDYDLLASVHDELIAEADEDKGNVEEFENLMATIKPWAEGCPVKAEGWTGFRYRK